MSGAPTVPELLELLAEETDPDERDALLRAAETAALAERSMCASYLLLISDVYIANDDRENAARLIELALERAEDRIWDYRDAAKRWLQLDEPDYAVEALEEYEEQLRNDARPGYLWRLLAEGFAHDLGDADGAARCLARASATAESVDDYCSVAAGLWDLAGDREGAQAALETAAKLAETGDARQGWWTIANAYSAIGDELNVRSTLLRGSEVARTVDQHLVMASAWQSQFPNVPEAVAALRAAQNLASTAGEYLDVAEANYEHGGGEAAVRACLEAALNRTPDVDDLHRIARGFRQWLDDPARAAEIAPAGVRPDEIATQRRRLAGWTADPNELFDWLRPQMNYDRLVAIAGADYGMEFDRHLVALQEIVDTGLIPQPLDWHPQEVLHLTRWSQGVQVDHVVRAFACTVVCLAEAEDFGRSDADAVILLDSCLALDAVAKAVGLFVMLVEASTWVLDDGDEDHEVDALLALLLAAGSTDPTDERLNALAVELLRCEGLEELLTDSMRDDLWLRLAGDILPHIVAAQPEAGELGELTRWVTTLGT